MTSINVSRKKKAWQYICIAHLTRCLADRSFSFFLPLYLSKQCSSSTLRPTAAFALVQNLDVALLSTTVAKRYKDAVKKKKGSSAFVIATILENVAVALVGIFIYAYLNNNDNNNDGNSEYMSSLLQRNREDHCDNPLSSNYFRLALLCGSIDAIFSSLLSMIISKEWVASLFCNITNQNEPPSLKSNSQKELAKANASLSQIDLIVGALSPPVISYLIALYGYHIVLMIAVIQHLIGALVIIICIRKAVLLHPSLVDDTTAKIIMMGKEKKKQVKYQEEATKQRQQLHDVNSFPHLFSMLPIQTRLISISYILLYFTILSPGAMLNSWMNSMNKNILIMNETTIAYFGTMSQLCGAFATFLAPILIRKTKSLQKASAISQWFQTICICYGFSCFYRLHRISVNNEELVLTNEVEASELMIQFLVSIGISRIGLWSFDLVERQVLQESVPSIHQTYFFNGEKSTTQLFSLSMMTLCYVFPDPSSFIILVLCSVLAVVLSSVFIFVQLMI